MPRIFANMGVSIGTKRHAAAINRMVSVSGRSQRNDHESLLISRARRRFSSIMPPRMKPRIMGAREKDKSRSTVAANPNRTMS